ncbi:hypothetical protein [Streptomyces sp. NBC_00448]|uniref:hypothetical protein n=1 Tax=Streptomyces sp. NBC_00448 TaxID=2903652 RepID=UPI002E1E82B8
MADQYVAAEQLGRDLDALTGARLVLETVSDADTRAAMLRLVAQLAPQAAERARVMLAAWDTPEWRTFDGASGSGGEGA